MVRNLIVEIELAEPAVSEMQRHFLAQPTLMANAIAVTDQEHPDHQLGIDRGPAEVAVKCLELLMQIGQNGCREHVDPSQQVARRDHLVEAKLVKQLPLISVLPPHHRRLSCRLLSRNHCSLRSSTPFSTASTHFGSRQAQKIFHFDPPRRIPCDEIGQLHYCTSISGVCKASEGD